MWCSTPSCAEHGLVRRAWPGLLALALCGPVLASNQDLPPSAAAQIAGLTGGHPQLPGSRLQGQALLRFFGLQVYQAQLWTRPDFRPETMAQQPLVLELQYLRDLKGRSIAERSLEEMRRAGAFSEEQGRRWLAEMQRIFPDVKAGDRLTGLHQPGQGAVFWHNARPVGRVEDALFARLFFGIWLAPTTSEPDIRLALLGLQVQGGR